MEYKLYKHKTKTNKWLVVRTPEDIKEDYHYVYDVCHLENGGTTYEDKIVTQRIRSGTY